MQRVDDTPVHKILREAITNACAHADFYGRRGLVISKTPDGYSFANPGSMRVAKKEAIEGGVSDPRNGVVLKIFSLINYGERAGSGLNSIFHVWKHVYHTPAEIREEVGVDRVVVSLPNGGHEQDVKAMLELYDNPEELTFPDSEVSGKVSGNDENVRKDGGLTDKMSDKQSLKDKIRRKLSDKTKMPSKMSDKLSDIVVLAFSNEFITTSMVVLRLAIDERNARRYLTRLVDLGYLTAEGENRNKKYRYKKDAGTDSCTE
jgi:predicted HTH transcriptional regulator